MDTFASNESRITEWAPSRQLTLEQARQRSRFIRVWRWACISAASGVGLLVLAFAAINSFGGEFGFDSQVSARDALRMINPRFTGRSTDGYGYVVNASTAVRRSRVSELMDLERPNFVGASGQVITAPKGIYSETTKTLDLNGGVVFQDKSGNRFDTSTAHIDSVRDRVVGSGAIRGGGPIGTVRGDNYEIRTDGGSIFITGNIRGMIKDSSP